MQLYMYLVWAPHIGPEQNEAVGDGTNRHCVIHYSTGARVKAEDALQYALIGVTALVCRVIGIYLELPAVSLSPVLIQVENGGQLAAVADRVVAVLCVAAPLAGVARHHGSAACGDGLQLGKVCISQFTHDCVLW